MTNNKTKFKTYLYEYLAKNYFERREQLVQFLADKTDYSKSRVENKITELIQSGYLIRFDYNEAIIKGIRVTDKRAKFITLKQSEDIKNHLDKVFSLLKSKDLICCKTALREIDSYKKRYILYPSQLDILTKNLYKDDNELIATTLNLLHEEIILKGNEPKNIDDLVTVLRKLGDIYSIKEKEYSGQIYPYIIALLGHYNDDMVISLLKKDILKKDNIENHIECYFKKSTAKIIEEHRSELFELEIDLMKRNKTNAASSLTRIRKRALILLGMADSMDSNNTVYNPRRD